MGSDLLHLYHAIVEGDHYVCEDKNIDPHVHGWRNWLDHAESSWAKSFLNKLVDKS